MMKNYKKFILIFFPFLLFSQTELFEKKNFIVENDTLRYRILAPLDYDANKKYPVHLFLHGAGERGNDNEVQKFLSLQLISNFLFFVWNDLISSKS